MGAPGEGSRADAAVLAVERHLQVDQAGLSDIALDEFAAESWVRGVGWHQRLSRQFGGSKWTAAYSPSGLKRAEQDGEVTAGSALLPALETLGQDMAAEGDEIGGGRRVVFGAHLVCVLS